MCHSSMISHEISGTSYFPLPNDPCSSTYTVIVSHFIKREGWHLSRIFFKNRICDYLRICFIVCRWKWQLNNCSVCCYILRINIYKIFALCDSCVIYTIDCWMLNKIWELWKGSWNWSHFRQPVGLPVWSRSVII